MICFFADDHYHACPGKHIYENLPEEWKHKIVFSENDFSLMENENFATDCELLVLHMIGTTCGLPHPGPAAEQNIRTYCERGGNLLLLHGSSAAFWQWSWWRKSVGLRWVRPGDPDGALPSVHPVRPYTVKRAKTRHELIPLLHDFSLPKDEIYTELEQVSPVTILMNTVIEGGTYPQAYESSTPWGGKVIGFLPGHAAEATADPDLIFDIVLFLQYLLR